MRKLLYLVLPLAVLVLTGRVSFGQLAPDAAVGDGCCGKVCSKPIGCVSPTRQTSKRCQALVYNAGSDAPNFSGGANGGGGCAQLNDLADPSKVTFCIGGGGNSGFQFAGCECIDGSCNALGGGCTSAAVAGCGFGGAVITTLDDPDCDPC